MQTARHGLRDGAGHRLPRPRDACGLRRDLPGVPARLLWLFRPDGDAEHRMRWPKSGSAGREPSADLVRAFRTFNAAAEPFRERGATAHGD